MYASDSLFKRSSPSQTKKMLNIFIYICVCVLCNAKLCSCYCWNDIMCISLYLYMLSLSHHMQGYIKLILFRLLQLNRSHSIGPWGMPKDMTFLHFSLFLIMTKSPLHLYWCHFCNTKQCTYCSTHSIEVASIQVKWKLIVLIKKRKKKEESHILRHASGSYWMWPIQL